LYGAVHNATVPVELKNTQYAGLLDPGRYNVSVKMGDKAKKCITGIKIFGNEKDFTDDCYTDKGCIRTLHPVTEPKIEFQFSSDPECMRDMSVYITIVHVTTDGAELDDKMAFQIGLRPLAVSFEDLVRVVANPYFGRISDRALLSSEVGYLLAKAAFGKISDWKKEIPPHTKEPVVDAGNTKVQISFNGSDYCYYSPDKEHWEWRLCSSKGWPVFVKDAEDWKDLQKGSCALPDKSDKSIYNIVENTYGSGAYNNYLLEVTYGDMITKCKGLEEYGSKAKLIDEAVSLTSIPIYAGACAVTTFVCASALSVGTGGLAYIDAIKSATFDCTIAPAITVGVYKLTGLEDTVLGNRGIWFGGLFGPVAVGGTRTLLVTTRGAISAMDNMKKLLKGGDEESLQKAASQVYRYLKRLKTLGFDIDDQTLKTFEKLPSESGEEIRKTIQKYIKNGDWDDIIKSIKDGQKSPLRLLRNRQTLVGASCRAFGAAAGSIAWYFANVGGLHIPHLHIRIYDIQPIAHISVTSTNIARAKEGVISIS